MRGRVRVSKRAARPRRRGVLLLVVLSLLVLFALIGVTYVVVAGQYRRASVATVRAEARVDDYQRQLDDGAYQVFRGSRNPLSPLYDQSLLEDMYGNDSFTGSLAMQNPPSDPNTYPLERINGQLIDILLLPDQNYLNTLPQVAGYFNGCVFTMLTGPAKGLSTRIIGYQYVAPTGSEPPKALVRVMPFESLTAANFCSKSTASTYTYSSTPSPTLNVTVQGNKFLINGRAFNGTGFGYNTTTGKLDLGEAGSTNKPYVLLPNHVFTQPAGGAFSANIAPDEDYDAPDLQNLFMAYIADQGPGNLLQASNILPSFHRPDLLLHLINGGSLTPELARKASLRPSVLDHPQFTGSNPSFQLNWTQPNVTWDIDNDGDGITDSVWIDPGFPVMTAKDGRQYKRLYAYLCVDLDGKLNANAHGSPAQLEQTFTANPPNSYFFAKSGGPADNQLSLPRGQGYGPAEINLQGLFAGSAVPAAQQKISYMQFLAGTTQREGRYGEQTRVPGALPAYYPADDSTNSSSLLPLAGTTSVDSSMALVKYSDMPPYNAGGNVDSAYSMPWDLWGRGFTALDPFGTALTPGQGNPWEMRNSPYELDLNRKVIRASRPAGGIDNPFTVAELERLLRRNDIDSRLLPDRLLTLLDSNNNNYALGRLVTTDSFDVPSPFVHLPRELKFATAANKSLQTTTILDLLQKRMAAEAYTGNVAAFNQQAQKMLALDLINGLRMDINRPIGNSRDDNGNAIVDDSAETDEKVWPNAPPARSEFLGVPFSHNNDSAVADDSDGARRLLARSLYVLVMLLKPKDVNIDFNGNTGDNSPAETTRGIAQWAVNVVDYRDRDSIMTAFKYDTNPFDGWDVDDNLTNMEPQADLVWGCERPELLITETLATHERRTEDLNTDASSHKTTDAMNPDDDFDQRLRPRGSLFVELYNPWMGAESRPTEFYHDGNSYRAGVLLNKKANNNGSPIWRLLIIHGANAATAPPLDPDAPVAAQRPNPADYERAIYFTNPAGTVTDGVQVAFYPSDGGNGLERRIAPLLPGRYAVIGPSGKPGQNSSYVTAFGRKTGAADGTDPSSNQTHRIVLSPRNNPNTPNQVQVLDNTYAPTTTNSSNPIAVVIDQPRSLNVSDPVAGYSDNPGTSVWDPAGAGGEGAYTPPVDRPLDFGQATLMQNGTQPNFCTVHLQRLANPTKNWNQQTNPYRTIDSANVDLTVYNGVTTDTHATEPIGSLLFQSWQRGDQNPPPAGTPLPRNLWQQSYLPVTRTAIPDTNNHVLAVQLKHSLGYVSEMYGPVYGQPSGTAPPSPAYAGAPDLSQPNSPPFPWLAWGNRPYVSQMELLLVPSRQSSQLLRSFSLSSGATNYATDASTFTHLLNFAYSDNTDNPTAGGSPPVAPNFCRLLDFLHVPSKFVGTEIELNPKFFSATNPGAETLHPPFNRISTYREPGRLNINTINSQTTWNALFGWSTDSSGNPTRHPGPGWNTLVASRSGYSGATNAAFPSMFSNPFRSALGAPLGFPNLPAPHDKHRDVDVTLLRASGADLSGNGLFEFPSADASVASFNKVAPYNDPMRSAAFRYQELTRLGNLVTTRSNVYAIWVTVGYFEVQSVATDQGHPDGYALGQELGIDTGEVQRHRGFYIFDRTIPVGFQRGDDFNTDKAVLLKRFIE